MNLYTLEEVVEATRHAAASVNNLVEDGEDPVEVRKQLLLACIAGMVVLAAEGASAEVLQALQFVNEYTVRCMIQKESGGVRH